MILSTNSVAQPQYLVGHETAQAVWPDALVTGGGIDGVAPRIRVDVGQTGFFAGREFRSFKELNIAASQTYVIRLVTTVNTIAFGLGASIESGHLRMASVAGGTEGGSFSETLPVIRRNAQTTTPAYAATSTLTAGGTHTGGTETDVLRLKANNNTNQAATIGAEIGDERGGPPGTYYVRLTNLSATDPIVGVWYFRFEERP